MKAQVIENILNTNLKVDSIGRVQGKSKAINAIQSEHWRIVDSQLTDLRIFVARISIVHKQEEILKMIDDKIYKIQNEF